MGNVPYHTVPITTLKRGIPLPPLTSSPTTTYEFGTVGNVPYPTARTTTYEIGTDEKRALLAGIEPYNGLNDREDKDQQNLVDKS
jgi:hypothetical protein